MTRKRTNNLNNNKGIAVAMSVIVVAAMVGLAMTIATISQRILSVNKSIGESEIAFYAAESASELVLYEIEKNDTGLSLPDVTNQALDTITGAFWGSEVKVATSTPGICSATQPKPACSDSGGTITFSNPLRVTLQDNQSFQLDLGIVGAGYPDVVDVEGVSAGTRVLIVGPNGQQEYTSNPVVVPPPTDTIDPADGYQFRVINETGSEKEYIIRPVNVFGSDDLPLGIKISTTGTYRNTNRRVNVTVPAWAIY